MSNSQYPSELFMNEIKVGEAEPFYYVPNGVITDDLGTETPCSFEVGYILETGWIIAIAYPHEDKALWKFRGMKRQYTLSGKVEGEETRIVAQGWRWSGISSHSDPNIQSNLRMRPFRLSWSVATTQSSYKTVFNISGLHATLSVNPKLSERFMVNNDLVMNLTVMRDTAHTVYPNDVTAKLAIDSQGYSQENLETIADLWCNVIFMAWGQNPTWLSVETYDDAGTLLSKTWRQGFHRPVLAPFGGILTDNRYVKLELSFLNPFTAFALSTILNNPQNTMDRLRKFLDVYKTYVTATDQDIGQARLVSSLTEELLIYWKEEIATDPWGRFEQEHKEKIDQLLNGVQTAPNYEDLKRFISPLNRPSLKEMFVGFFEAYDVPTNIFEDRVNMFRNTRNGILHNGRFHKSNKSHRDSTRQHKNVLMMIPFMLVLMLAYEGEYTDFYLNKKIHQRFVVVE